MILTHEGYIAKVGYEDGDQLMHGSVTNTRALLHFAGRNIDELKQAFADTIADYQAWCNERRVAPEKPYSGTLSLRIPPELHRRIAEQAAKAGESLNQFITEQLEKAQDGLSPAISPKASKAQRSRSTALKRKASAAKKATAQS
jgi:predicted HicB family RNase H-like nuclease